MAARPGSALIQTLTPTPTLTLALTLTLTLSRRALALLDAMRPTYRVRPDVASFGSAMQAP